MSVSTHLTPQKTESASGLPGAPTFEYRDGALCCEEIPVERIYNTVGPCYVYSTERLRDNARRMLKAFSRGRGLVCFASKANANPALFEIFHQLGLGLEVSSGNEFQLGLQAGLEASEMVISGNARKDSELRQFAGSGAYLISVDSDEEIQKLEQAAAELRAEGRLNAPVRAAIRINPNIDAKVSRHVATGLAESKFGLPAERALAWFLHPEKTPHLVWSGIHIHIGSQILDIDPLMEVLRNVSDFVDRAREGGAPLDVLNVGGGYGVDYTGKGGLALERFADAASLVANNLGMKLVTEPGRFLVADTCALIGQVLYVKRTRRSFVVTELAMNDLMRPSLYNAHHEIVPVKQAPPPTGGRGTEEIVDVVGPICESSDFLARDRRLPAVQPGSLLAVTGAGAYGYSMASNYNGRGRLPEVLVNGSRVRLIRRGEDWQDLMRLACEEDLDLSISAETIAARATPRAARSSETPEPAKISRAAPGQGRRVTGSLGAGIAEGLRRRKKGEVTRTEKAKSPAKKKTVSTRGSGKK